MGALLLAGSSLAPVLILIASVTASAQMTRGSISGTVLDASGAVIQAVDVTAREQNTGVSSRGMTNDSGVFRLVALEPGIYMLEFTKAGFELRKVEGIVLESAQDAVVNPTLTISGAASSVTVDASSEGVALSKASPAIERHIGAATVESLPLTGARVVEDVTLLAPGVVDLGLGASTNLTTNSLAYSAGGQRSTTNVFTINGIDNADPQYQYIGAKTTPETVSELHVRLNPYSAEFGRGLGAQISVITRSGTNALHGAAWDYYTGNSLSATSLANKRAGVAGARFSDHQAGGSIGGPLIRNRSFFFAYFEALPHREGASATAINPVTIPTQAGLQALARVPLAAGQTAESRRAALDALGFLPSVYSEVRRFDQISVIPINGVPVEFARTTIPIARPSDAWRWQVRLDHRPSDRDTVTYLRNTWTWEAAIARLWTLSNNGVGTRFASRESLKSHNDSLSHTHVFGPALVNEVRVSASRRYDFVAAPPNSGMRTAVNQYFNIGPHPFDPFDRPSNTYEAQDTMTWMKGRHALKFGAHLVSVHDTLASTRQSQWTFPNFAALINSQPSRLEIRVRPVYIPVRSLKQNYFVQDDLRLTSALTVNFGVRYQLASIPRLLRDIAPELIATGMPGPVRRDINDLDPRFGFAWSPGARSGWIGRVVGNGLTVFRGGFGIAHGVVYEGDGIGANILGIATNYPYNSTAPFDQSQIVNRYPALPPYSDILIFDPQASQSGYAADSKNPTAQFYSFSIQRQAAQNVIVEIGYTGSRDDHLMRARDLNYAVLTPEQAMQTMAGRPIPDVSRRRLNPAWGMRLVHDMGGNSQYNAGYIKVDRRFSRGFLVGANYTYSGSFGDSVGFAAPGLRVPQNPTSFRPEYGRTEIDRPHRFVVHYVFETPGKHLWSGWRLSGISQWQSGAPFTIRTGVDSNGDGSFRRDRPDYNPAGVIRLDPVTGDWRSFSTPLGGSGIFITPLDSTGRPAQYTMPNGGNLGVNTFRGPSAVLHNFSVMKLFRVGERWQLELRGDWTNVFNHRNFGPPVETMNDLSFGGNTSDPPSRVTLISAKLRF